MNFYSFVSIYVRGRGCHSSSSSHLPRFAFFTLTIPFSRCSHSCFSSIFSCTRMSFWLAVTAPSLLSAFVVGVMVLLPLRFGCVSLLALYIFGTPLTLWFGTFCFHCREEKDKTCVDKIYFFLPFTTVFAFWNLHMIMSVLFHCFDNLI